MASCIGTQEEVIVKKNSNYITLGILTNGLFLPYIIIMIESIFAALQDIKHAKMIERRRYLPH